MRSVVDQVFAALVAGLALATLALEAKAATGFLKGEMDQGFSKVCFYDVLGETHTLNIPSTKLCPLSYQFEVIPRAPAQPPASGFGKTGFLNGEREQGFTKICYYDVLGEVYMITISSVKLCPLTYEFR